MCPGTLWVPPAGPTTKWTSAIISLLNMTEFLRRHEVTAGTKDGDRVPHPSRGASHGKGQRSCPAR